MLNKYFKIFFFLFSILIINALQLKGNKFYTSSTNFFSFEQSTDKIENDIYKAISQGNVRLLSQHFFSNIELSLPNVRGNFSRTQAEFILKNFFESNPVSSFSIISEGSSGSDKTRFFLGNYASSNGQKYRVYYLIKEISGKELITILRFE